MTATPPTRRSPAASAAALIAVLLLFGALTFVAGLAVGGGDGASVRRIPSPTPRSVGGRAVGRRDARPAPTPVLETITCAEPSEAFAVLCETYAQIKGEYVDEISDEDLVDGAVRGMIEYGLRGPVLRLPAARAVRLGARRPVGRVQRHRRRGRDGEPRRPRRPGRVHRRDRDLRHGHRGAARRLAGRGGRPARRRPGAGDRRDLDGRRVGLLARVPACAASPAPTSRSDRAAGLRGARHHDHPRGDRPPRGRTPRCSRTASATSA